MTKELGDGLTVVIVGAGPAGLTAAVLLQTSGIRTVVLERQSRSYVEGRQRAGIVDTSAVRMFQEWGLADEVLGGIPFDGVLEVRVDGRSRFIDEGDIGDGVKARLCPQQVLVKRLATRYLQGGGDLRFEAAAVALSGIDGERPTVTYRDAGGVSHSLAADFVAGCDGDRGVSRQAMPEGSQLTYPYDHGVAHLTVLAEAPPPARPLLAVSTHGYAAHFPRGPHASRFYVQCAPDDQVADWPHDRIWEQLRARLGRADLAAGPINDLEVFRLRSVMREPISHGRLFLLGDAAHVISPMGAKGMNLALYEADVFARAVGDFVQGDGAALAAYSQVCVERSWNYQEFSHWMTEMLHDSGDTSRVGPFRGRMARARLERLFTSGRASAAFAELMAGLG